jgi:hypothetical protein
MPSKLTTKFSGPFEVVSQTKTDVSCKHLVHGSIHVFHVTELKIFHGSREEAYKLAMVDFNQFVVKNILGWRGDPLTRTTMEFLVEFEDGAQVWKTWERDITDTQCFEEYCRANRPLRFLLYGRAIADRMCKELRNSDITEVNVGDRVYVDLRSYGATWYGNLGLPNCDTVTYAAEYVFTQWDKGRRRIKCACAIFAEEFVVDRVFIQMYGMQAVLPANWILIDETFTKEFPQVLPGVHLISSSFPLHHSWELMQRPKEN